MRLFVLFAVVLETILQFQAYRWYLHVSFIAFPPGFPLVRIFAESGTPYHGLLILNVAYWRGDFCNIEVKKRELLFVVLLATPLAGRVSETFARVCLDLLDSVPSANSSCYSLGILSDTSDLRVYHDGNEFATFRRKFWSTLLRSYLETTPNLQFISIGSTPGSRIRHIRLCIHH